MERSSARHAANIWADREPDLKLSAPLIVRPQQGPLSSPGQGAQQENFYLITFWAEPSPFDRVRGHGREGEPTCGGFHVGIGTYGGSGGVVSCPISRALEQPHQFLVVPAGLIPVPCAKTVSRS